LRRFFIIYEGVSRLSHDVLLTLLHSNRSLWSYHFPVIIFSASIVNVFAMSSSTPIRKPAIQTAENAPFWLFLFPDALSGSVSQNTTRTRIMNGVTAEHIYQALDSLM
jgi:hypothetical protein